MTQTKINNGILEALTEKIFNEEVPWPAIRTIWKEQFRKVSPLFLEAEALRTSQYDSTFL